MSSLRKLRTYVDDSKGNFRENVSVVKRYALAYDDHEFGELRDLLVFSSHYGSFWGTVRGPDAAIGVALQEKEALRLTWTESFQPITSNVFERSGYVQFLDRSSRFPLVDGIVQRMQQQKVRESIVVDDGIIVFRDLGLQWRMMVA